MNDEAALPDLSPLRDWFTSYCDSFRIDDPAVQRNYDLKQQHTSNVCRDALIVAQGMPQRFLVLAEVAALCHDLGRFPQYRDYGTFKDSESLNHAHLSAQIMKRHAPLHFLSGEEFSRVDTAVRMHNAFHVPTGLHPETDALLRLLRDADKLDIWGIFEEYFEAPESERASAAGLGFPDLPGCSPEPLADVAAGRMVHLSTLKSLNDFKLLQVSWIYDINYLKALRLIRERGILDRFAAMLPDERPVREVLAQVREHLERRLETEG
ncbi:HD domain-containing protein [Geomonas edaphica]|uniref:HD domain-containing protein n=1 Tax=Geomonas edaphica TaxID=2570226 RepID=UPI0010A86EBA|nr:HD domain-containing protein [Geomonas edaphica]